MTRATVGMDGETITVHIPMVFKKRGGRKLVVTPDGAAWAPRPRVDNAMVKALARAFRWRKLLDLGVHATIEDLSWTLASGPMGALGGEQPFAWEAAMRTCARDEVRLRRASATSCRCRCEPD